MMLIKDIVTNNRTLIGLILMSMLVLFYVRNTNSPIKADDLVLINGILEETPVYGEYGGETPVPYIRLSIKEHNNRFYLEGCGYYQANTNEVLELKPNDKIQIGVQSSKLEQNKVSVSMLSVEGEKILDLNEYNECFDTYWKYLIMPIIIMFIILIVRVIKSVIKS